MYRTKFVAFGNGSDPMRGVHENARDGFTVEFNLADPHVFVLNFEITAVVHDLEFAAEMETMFEKDFARSDPLDPASFAKKPLWHRFAVRACRLMAPIQ